MAAILKHEDENGLTHQCPRDPNPLLHSARQFVGEVLGKGGKPDELDEMARQIAALGLTHAVDLERELDVAKHGTPRQQAEILEHHDAVELSALLGKVLRGEAAAHSLEQYDRFRRPLNIEYVQQQTIANKKRLEEKDSAARARNNDALRRTAADPAAHRAYLLRASLIDSVRKRAAAAA